MGQNDNSLVGVQMAIVGAIGLVLSSLATVWSYQIGHPISLGYVAGFGFVFGFGALDAIMVLRART